MIKDVPVYFPFTFLEPERVEKLHELMGKFKAYRVFEKNVSDEIAEYEENGKIICQLFRLSSENSVKIAHKFLDWSKSRDSLDLKTVAAFFNYMEDSNESVDIIGSMDAVDKDCAETSAFNEILLRQEITLFLIQLLDRQEYEINSAFRRISQNHKRLFIESEKLNPDILDSGSSNLSGFRLDNMSSRIVSWLAAFFFLSEQSKIIFTDEKEAFLVFIDFFKNDEIMLYKANTKKSGLPCSELIHLASSFMDNKSLDSDFFEVLENGKQVVEESGDLFFAVSDDASFNKTMARVIGLKSESMSECALLSSDCKKIMICFVI